MAAHRIQKKALGINSDKHNIQIDIRMNGLFAVIFTGFSTKEKLLTCTHVILGDTGNWDTNKDNLSR